MAARALICCLIVLLALGGAEAATATVPLTLSAVTLVNFNAITTTCPNQIYRDSAATAGYDFMDTSGFSTITAVDIEFIVTLVSGVSTMAINGDTPFPLTTQSGNCNGPSRLTSMPTPSLYVPGGFNSLRFTTTATVDISDVLNGADTEFAILTITGTVAGGGGDPHLVAPYLPRMELHSQLQLAEPTRDVGDFDALLLASSDTELSGLVRAEPGTDKFYFTSFDVTSPSDSLRIGFAEVEGRAFASMELAYSNAVVSCAMAGDEFELQLSGSAFLRLQCSNAVERAAGNRLMQEHFGSHVGHAEAVVSLETRHFSAELFFIQKEANRPDFGFYDFSVVYHTDEVLSGIFTNDHSGHDEAARDTMSADESTRRRFHEMSKAIRESIMFK